MTTETEEAETGQWARDLIETELARAGEEGLTKAQLQGGLSLGTDDLRVGLEALREEGLLIETKGGSFTLRDLAVGQRPDADLEEAAAQEAESLRLLEEDEDADALRPDDETVPGLEETTAQVAAADGFYRTRLMLDVSFKPDPPGGDETAVREARDLAKYAELGILKRFPDLAVSSGVVSVDAFEEPRHVWP